MRQDERIAGSRSKLDDGRSEQGPTTHRSADQSSEHKLQLLKETRAQGRAGARRGRRVVRVCVLRACMHVCDACVKEGEEEGGGRGRGKGEERRKCRVRRLIC